MSNGSSTTRRFLSTIVALGAAAFLLIAIGGPGTTASDADSAPVCKTTCIDAGGTFGPTVPVSIDEESADRFASIINGESARTGRITMNFISVDEGTAVEVLSSDERIAQVRLSAGRVGYVPVAWVSGA
jgi:ABC-type glycerol-3-phosphate transport system substrate-binding protein